MKLLHFTLTGMLLLVGLCLGAQTTVRGVITSAKSGEPLIGATVVIKGSTVGTTTDVDGSFQL